MSTCLDTFHAVAVILHHLSALLAPLAKLDPTEGRMPGPSVKLQPPICPPALPSSSVPERTNTNSARPFPAEACFISAEDKTKFILNEAFSSSSSLCTHVHTSATCGPWAHNSWVFACSWSPHHTGFSLLTCLIVLSPASCPHLSCFHPSAGSVSLCSVVF